ncbi:isocitrate/isopropylmalate dehydrogenase family protein [Pararoseomonas indoligenes]|uniref:Isocitrate/isopropylmalate dehydrogenase family protein n=1 Tax=Roseomonas indoligenes TaxID=2820811 RepID=A0A940SA73_9PROT|nr:isocitrate/isopropylmalate family dehydrogenase [Pararoseomonas indoligenes]MBP0496063.1 isocitrate/isopropylmalate dehydrogenase family protein [Pararoseomonas indoligenes]
MRILVLPGDGVGPEITAATLAVLEAARGRFSLPLDLRHDVVGRESHRLHGSTARGELLEAARGVDGVILGPADILESDDERRGEINPSKFFRKGLDLFANIRPCRTYAGLPGKVGEFDLVVVRENTEGFYADRNMEAGNGEILVTPEVAISLRRITRACSLRIAEAACELAMRRGRRLTVVHKANVLKVTDGLFLGACRDVVAGFPEIAMETVLVDSMMAHVVRDPRRFDVVVTTNMFGDILSDLTAELSGSLGLGGSLNAGKEHAMAQAAHGSAPDIAGKDVANPFSLVLSAALLLSWHGRRTRQAAFAAAGAAIEDAVSDAIGAGEATRDIGGRLGTVATAEALAARIRAG